MQGQTLDKQVGEGSVTARVSLNLSLLRRG